ncbi:hypothetical protein ncot_11370 [Nocardioides sp. JQ2195]|uniref:hypothetical protein n=1 Tax=Nocardioides sp. JQ2195 TaxID=2592334 RepID=UPI00143E8C6D|nr:hypothetical protein [Nocardioides sp. JQ2195]QIX27129.1 hypothetical protein ncot_11370 [Nocardioides sp. JQ2195]
MPMPPPKPTTEGSRDRGVAHEERQIVKALRANGPQSPDELAALVGAPYWEKGRFERALSFALADGFVHRTSEGSLATS